MAWRIHDHVVEGEIDNTVKGRVTGWLRIVGEPKMLQLDLGGNCHPDLAGWRFRIERIRPVAGEARGVEGMESFSADQIGDAGDITYCQVVQQFDCPVEEYLRRRRMGEKVPDYWRRALYLEWYSDCNGRVVVQDTRLAAVTVGKRAFEMTYEDFIRQDSEAREQLEEFRRQGWVIEELPFGTAFYHEGSDEEDPLQRQLDERSAEIDAAIDGSRETAFQDDDHEFSDPLEGKRIRNLFEPELRLPPNLRIPENRVERTLERVLAKLAEKRITIRYCKHFTPRMVLYWLGSVLVEEATEEIKMNGGLFDTSEKCAGCVEERDFQGYEAPNG